jgi:hypothetical protein
VAKFPEPPGRDRLLDLGPTLHVLPAGAELWRIYFLGGSHPRRWDEFRFFGPINSSRFDHHLPPPREQPRGILYAAQEIATCVAEAFQEERRIDVHLNDPWLVGFALAGDVTLHDLTGTWPTLAGASMAISSGLRARARRWSQALYDAYPRAQGLHYCSSMHANRPAVALYERARNAVGGSPFFHRALADPVLLNPLREIAHRLGYALG